MRSSATNITCECTASINGEGEVASSCRGALGPCVAHGASPCTLNTIAINWSYDHCLGATPTKLRCMLRSSVTQSCTTPAGYNIPKGVYNMITMIAIDPNC